MKNWVLALVNRYPDLGVCGSQIEAAYQLLARVFQQGGKLLICGNGGSAADSEHIVGELMKGYLLARPIPDELRSRLVEAFPEEGAYLAGHLQRALPAISLVSQTALLSAIANDVTADMVYAQQVYGYGEPGDALLGISTSGNAKNVLHALQMARTLGLRTIGLTGASGGALRELCDTAICVPSEQTPDIQERHVAIYHALCAQLEENFFGETPLR